MNDYKRMIPNILTLTRIVFTPILIIVGFFGKTKIIIILAILCALTDLLDGRLARKWNVVSNKGAKLDAIADKVFAIGLTASLMKNFHLLIVIFLLELVIAATNLYYFKNIKKVKSLMIGKIKTALLFITIISYIITTFSKGFLTISVGFSLATINLQLLSLLFYYQYYLKEVRKRELETEHTEAHQKIMNETDLESTIPVDDLIDLVKKYHLNEEEKID